MNVCLHCSLRMRTINTGLICHKWGSVFIGTSVGMLGGRNFVDPSGFRKFMSQKCKDNV